MSKKNSINKNKYLYRYFIFIIVGVSLGWVIPNFLDMVEALGHNIPQEDLKTDYVIAVAWSIILALSIFMWPVSGKDKKRLLFVWIVKVFVVLGFMLFYENNYSLDAYGFFIQSNQLDLVWNNQLQPSGTLNILRLAWLHHQLPFLGNSYHAMKVSFSMIGLVAIYIFYRAVVIFLQKDNVRVFYVLAFLPSILFWSSILGKEPILLMGVALYVYGVIGFYCLKKNRYLFVLILGALEVFLVRIWLVPILLMPLPIIFFLMLNNGRARVKLVIFAFFMMVCILRHLMINFGINSIEGIVQTVDSLALGFSSGGSQMGTVRFTNVVDLMVYMPLGIFTALFRPLPGEVFNIFGLLAGIENMVLLLFLWLAVRRTRWRELREPIVMGAIMVVFAWAIVYGCISQNLGTLSRYKLPILPVLIVLLLYLNRHRSRLLS